MATSLPPATQPPELRRASRITARARGGALRAASRSRGSLEREHGRLTRRCADLRESVEEAGRAQSALLDVLAHDLRNPLSVILMSARLLARAPPIPPRESGTAPSGEAPNRRLIEGLSRAAEEISNLAQDMSDAGRLEAGRLAPTREAVDVASLVTRAVEATRALAESKHLRLTSELAGPIPAASGDRERMTRVLLALLANAVKFTPKNGAVTVRARAVEGEIRISIEDTGPGLSADQRAQLFTLPKSTKQRVGQGAGLSLFVARGTVEAQGGRLWAESEPGHGSTFFFAHPEAIEDEER